jgi:hypothetical protein
LSKRAIQELVSDFFNINISLGTWECKVLQAIFTERSMSLESA